MGLGFWIWALFLLYAIDSIYAIQVRGKEVTFYVAIVAIKGDWPFLRKAMHLSVGFTSKRKCHLCPGSVVRLTIENRLDMYVQVGLRLYRVWFQGGFRVCGSGPRVGWI